MKTVSDGEDLVPEDIGWMRRALALADEAGRCDEVPIGAVLVRDGIEIGAGWNSPIACNDPTAHAEINALRKAAATMENYRLPDSVLYVTVEPCVMCAGAIVHARISRVVFGAFEPRTGAAGSVVDIIGAPENLHHMSCTGGVLADEASEKLKTFFREKRTRC